MDKIKNSLILGLSIAVIILLLVKGCGDHLPAVIVPGKTITTTIIEHDTIKAVDTIIKTKWLKPREINVIQPPNYNGLTNESICSMHRTYSDSIEDINQILYYTAKVTGRLDSIRLDYKLKIPLIINNTITTSSLRIDTLVRPNRWTFYGGLEVGGNKTEFNISPFVTLNAKNNSFTFRYGVLDQTYNIGVGIRIFKSRK